MKKALCLILAAAMALACLAGCGSSSKNTAFKIGGIGPITGPAAIYGQAVKNAAEIAVEEVNAKGGIQFELNFQDDAHDAETSVNAYGNLMDWGMQILVGTVTSTPAAAVAPEAEADGVFMLTPSASSPSVLNGTTHVFQMCFSDPNQGIASADYLAANGMGDSVAVIYNNGDAYSTGIYEKFASEAAAQGINVVYTGTFTDDSATDFSTQITDAQAAGASVMFLPIYYTPISLIMTQAAKAGAEFKYFGVDGMDGLLDLEGFDTALAEGAYLLTPFSADAEDELTQNFVKKYNEKFGENPNQFAADAYDCVYAVYNALNELGIKDYNMSAKELGTKLTEAFAGGFTFSGLTGSNMTWSAAGEVSKDPMAVVIENGAYASVK